MEGSDFQSCGLDRDSVISRILTLQQAIKQNVQGRGLRKRLWILMKASFRFAVVLLVIGRRLSRALVELIKAVHDRKRPYLGTELANTLEAASRKVIGYKRWLILVGLFVTMPGMLSMLLLWQQNQAVAQAKESRFADLRNQKRVELLITLYHTIDKSEAGLLTTPVFSAVNRRFAVLELINWDSLKLDQLGTPDPDYLNRMVDLSVAPLNQIDFSPIQGEAALVFQHVSFVNSNFENTSFENCSFERVWFSHAQLYHTNFRNARFKEVDFSESRIIGADFSGAEFILCNLKGALFDSTTRWPEGFDAVGEGARKLEP